MPNLDVYRYGLDHGVSFRQAKKAIRRKKKKDQDVIVKRGQPVEGTGRPKGTKK